MTKLDCGGKRSEGRSCVVVSTAYKKRARRRPAFGVISFLGCKGYFRKSRRTGWFQALGCKWNWKEGRLKHCLCLRALLR